MNYTFAFCVENLQLLHDVQNAIFYHYRKHIFTYFQRTRTINIYTFTKIRFKWHLLQKPALIFCNSTVYALTGNVIDFQPFCRVL